MWSSARSSLALEAGLPVPIDVHPMKAARRFRLRFDEASRRLKLTCPARASRRSALAWAADQREWIDAQLARAQPPEPFVAGATIPLEGREILLAWDAAAPRTPCLENDVLLCGGPESAFARRIEAFLKRRALDLMSREVAEFAQTAGVVAAAVTIGDPASRWGSCSSARRIRLSWRLILAPPNVRRFVVAHEVAHLVELNHGAEFKALEARLFGTGVAEARSLLRRIGPRLRRIGRRGR
ncbi:MAG: SprT family zinc-dependent metalloprotease [Sphingomicrobium sp.]